MSPLHSGGVGLLVGLHIASWGAYKDTPFEGFRFSSYLRSIALAAAVALVITTTFGLAAPGVVVLIGMVYAIERLATEGWKSILREQDQAIYTIPMRLGFMGKPIDRRRIRYTVGAIMGIGIVGLLFGIDAAQHMLPTPPALLVILTVGSAGGWATAIGGAWKDAPIEGFDGLKFLRSPAMATAWAIPLSFLTESWFALLLAAGGYAVATVETYKTFMMSARPPGKFAGRPIRAHYSRLRNVVAHQHGILWLIVASAFAAIASALHQGLPQGADLVFPELPKVLLGTVATGTCILGSFVIYKGKSRNQNNRTPVPANASLPTGITTPSVTPRWPGRSTGLEPLRKLLAPSSPDRHAQVPSAGPGASAQTDGPGSTDTAHW